MECPCCNKEVAAEKAACGECGYPMQGEPEAQRRFLYGKLVVMQAEVDDLLNWVSKSKYIMFFAAAITALRAVLLVVLLLGGPWDGLLCAFGIALLLLAGGLAVLGAGIEKHPVRNVAIGFVGTLLAIGGGFLGWVALTMLGGCVYCAAAYVCQQHRLRALRAKVEKAG